MSLSVHKEFHFNPIRNYFQSMAAFL